MADIAIRGATKSYDGRVAAVDDVDLDVADGELLVLVGPLRRDRIGELMWPGLDPVAAGRNVRVTLSRLRAMLEPFVAANYKPEPKRKHKRNDPFAEGAIVRDRDGDGGTSR